MTAPRAVGAGLALLLLAGSVRAAQAPPPEDPAAPPEEILGAPAAFGLEASAEPKVAVPGGTSLRELPDARSASLATIDVTSELPVVERSGAWLRVRFEARLGWVILDEIAPGTFDELAAVPPAALSSGAGAERRAEMRAEVEERLGPPTEDHPRIGAWTLYSNVEDPGLLAFLDQVVADLPDLYRERYGLDPGAPGDEAIALFAGEADYRAFAEEHAGLLEIGEGGYAGYGLAVLYTEGRDRRDLAALLLHELTHLLNARALGSRTPPWLEEGLADDLASSEIRPGGGLSPGTVGGAERRDAALDGDEVVIRASWEGGKGALIELGRHARKRELAPLQALTRMTWHELVDPARRSLLYAQSTFFVRYLVDREPDAFRRYLRYLAAGGADGPTVLTEALGRDWAALDRGFRRWLVERVAELGLLDAL